MGRGEDGVKPRGLPGWLWPGARRLAPTVGSVAIGVAHQAGAVLVLTALTLALREAVDA